jgi:hypothetical protein
VKNGAIGEKPTLVATPDTSLGSSIASELPQINHVEPASILCIHQCPSDAIRDRSRGTWEKDTLVCGHKIKILVKEDSRDSECATASPTEKRQFPGDTEKRIELLRGTVRVLIDLYSQSENCIAAVRRYIYRHRLVTVRGACRADVFVQIRSYNATDRCIVLRGNLIESPLNSSFALAYWSNIGPLRIGYLEICFPQCDCRRRRPIRKLS